METKTQKKTKKAKKTITIIAILGFALIALSGCGRSYGPYQYGYGGQYGNWSGYGSNSYPPNASDYNPGYRGFDPRMGYGYNRGGYCW